jgi:glycosyltransferase involved in cell wall biosynthesis
MNRTLVVTNDFPPRQGGIQTFVAALLARRPPESLVVLASRSPGWEAYDAALPYPVVRRPTGMLLPTRATARAAVDLARRHGCDTAFFGAAAPLGLLAPALRQAGVGRLVGATHGHETGWVALPGARQLLRRIADGLDVLTYISEYTRDRLEPALGARTRLAQLSPGVDVDAFTPEVDGAAVRERYGLGEAPVVVCVSRLVARKGQDVLVAGWPRVLRRHPDARLLLVGGGPAEASLRRAIARLGLASSVVLTGPVPPAEAAWTSRGSGWSTSRRPRAACRWWRGRPEARPRRCRRASPGTWSSRAHRRRSRTPSARCWPTRTGRAPWARPAGPGSSSAGRGRRSRGPSASSSTVTASRGPPPRRRTP